MALAYVLRRDGLGLFITSCLAGVGLMLASSARRCMEFRVWLSRSISAPPEGQRLLPLPPCHRFYPCVDGTEADLHVQAVDGQEFE
jgi:hypothetical protein